MEFKATKPEEMLQDMSLLEEALIKFDNELKEDDKGEDYYHLVIKGEYGRTVCDEVERIYSEAGWKRVKCSTSSEKGERSGLTGLQLYRFEM